MGHLKGKCALVTGGARELELAIANAFEADGAEVALSTELRLKAPKRQRATLACIPMDRRTRPDDMPRPSCSAPRTRRAPSSAPIDLVVIGGMNA